MKKSTVFPSLLFIAMMLFAISFIFSDLSGGESTVPCKTGAYVIDKDPAGLNVRETPNGKILTKIPDGAMVEILGYNNGWVKLGNVNYAENEAFAKKNKHAHNDGFAEIKNVNGWVSAKKLGTGVRKYSEAQKVWLFSEPSEKSKKGKEINVVEASVTVTECKGTWLKVQFKGASGWLSADANCPNSLTNCN